jgi:hypothetical protein
VETMDPEACTTPENICRTTRYDLRMQQVSNDSSQETHIAGNPGFNKRSIPDHVSFFFLTWGQVWGEMKLPGSKSRIPVVRRIIREVKSTSVLSLVLSLWNDITDRHNVPITYIFEFMRLTNSR